MPIAMHIYRSLREWNIHWQETKCAATVFQKILLLSLSETWQGMRLDDAYEFYAQSVKLHLHVLVKQYITKTKLRKHQLHYCRFLSLLNNI